MRSERCRYEAMCPVQSVRDYVLAAHGPFVAAFFAVLGALVAFLLLLFVRCRHTRDRDFKRQDWLYRTPESNLNRAAHLAGVDAGRQHAPKGANVIKIVAHE